MKSGMANSSTSIDLAERGDLVDGVVGEERAGHVGVEERHEHEPGDAEQERQDDPGPAEGLVVARADEAGEAAGVVVGEPDEHARGRPSPRWQRSAGLVSVIAMSVKG